MSAGLTLRHEGQEAVIAADVAPHRGFGDYIKDAIDSLMTDGLPFSPDAVRDVARIRWAFDHNGVSKFDPAPNLLPAILGGYVASGRIVRCGEYHSGRKSRRYGRNGVYRAA